MKNCNMIIVIFGYELHKQGHSYVDKNPFIAQKGLEKNIWDRGGQAKIIGVP